MRQTRFLVAALYTLVFFSGFAGLGYEMVWTRLFAVGLGHEMPAVLAMIAAFFSGLALGAWSLDRRVSTSRTPGRWYGAMEMLIGIWAVVLVFLIPLGNFWAARLMGVSPSPLRHWTVAFLIPFFLLLPATMAMGATLPAAERLFSRLRQDGWSVGGLYAANTLGAVAGTMLTTFIMAPVLGFRATLYSLAALNLLCGLGILAGPARQEKERPPVNIALPGVPVPVRLALVLFFTGLLGIGYEVSVVRVLSRVMENTIYSFAAVLSVYLFGTACGAALYQRFAPRKGFEQVLAALLTALSTACFLGIILLWSSPFIYRAVRAGLGGGRWGSMLGEVALAVVAFLLPTVCMGATFSHLAQGARGPAGGLGRAFGVNTFGSALAPALFGVVCLPALGAKATLIILASGYLMLVLLWRSLRRWLILAPLCLALLLLSIPSQLRLVDLPPGGKIVAHREGVMAAVTVVQDAGHNRYLKVDNHFVMGGTASYPADARQALIPLLLHPRPEKTLFLGLGTGTTLGAAALYPRLQADGVELIPEIVPLLPLFRRTTGHLPGQKRLKIFVADARRFVHATDRKYDVIVADLFHPARDGAGSLYTVEHFQAIRWRLRPGGLFCQWLPLYQLDLHVLQTIIRTFLHVFPEGSAVLAQYSLQMPVLGLVAGTDPLRYPPDWLERCIRDHNLRASLEAVHLQDSLALFGLFLAGRADLRTFAGPGPLNTDDRPVVVFEAPRFVYAHQDPPAARLLALMRQMHPRPGDILQAPHNPSEVNQEKRLAAYWQARQRFLLAGVGVEETNDPVKMLKAVREPLLSIVRQDQDFSPAYDPLLGLAWRLSRTEPMAARDLLRELEQANPRRQDAQKMREFLAKNMRRQLGEPYSRFRP
jgi:spermidine synthase